MMAQSFDFPAASSGLLLIDQAALIKISKGEAETERNLLLDFRHLNDADAKVLKSAIAEGDLAQVIRFSHRMKGACEQVGSTALGGVCRRIEQAARAGNLAQARQALPTLDHELDRLHSFLDLITARNDVSSSPAASMLHNLSFLVVEDHDFQRRGIVQLLVGLGALAVHSAHDGACALEVIRDKSRSVDIVISDLTMPGMDGFEFARHMRVNDRTLSLIFVSSHEPRLLGAIAELTRSYSVNLLGTISKPLNAAKLAPMIELYRARESGAAVALPLPPSELEGSP